MKKFFLFLTCLFTWTLASAEVADKKISFNNLPQTARQFVKKHFPNHKVLEVEMDDDRTYEVSLTGDIQIDFNKNGHWREIESEDKGIPFNSLPDRVRRKVTEKYPHNVRVLEVEREGDDVKVKLSGNREMTFKRLYSKKHK